MEFFTDSDLDTLVFFQVPKVLVLGDRYIKMKPNALKLYMVLFDKMKLSIKNGWKDETGRYYVRMSQEGAADVFGWSPTTFRAMKKELASFELLDQGREGQGKSNRLYLAKCKYDEKDVYTVNKTVDTELEENEKKAQDIDASQKNNFCSSADNTEKDRSCSSAENTEKDNSCLSRRTEVDLLEEQLLTPNKNNFNNNNFNNNNKNLNLNPIDRYEILWNTSLPMDLKTRVKVMIANNEINLNANEILSIDDAYKYQIMKGYIIPNCSMDDTRALNDFEFSKTVCKMLTTVKGIRNMKGIIKEWVEIAYAYKNEQFQEFGGPEDRSETVPFYNWLEA